MSGRDAAARLAVVALLALLTGLVAVGCAPAGDEPTTSTASGQPRTTKVLRVVDGDTIIVRRRRGAERVRYIGIDTPESVKPDTPVQCFGREASDFNRRLVEGKTVRLEGDREPRDRFGRTLAYVWVGERMVNAELLSGGYARTLRIPPNTANAAYFSGLQRVAKRTRRGLWNACER